MRPPCCDWSADRALDPPVPPLLLGELRPQLAHHVVGKAGEDGPPGADGVGTTDRYWPTGPERGDKQVPLTQLALHGQHRRAPAGQQPPLEGVPRLILDDLAVQDERPARADARR